VSPGGKSAELDPNPNYYFKKQLCNCKQIHVALGLRQGSIPEGNVAKKMGVK
jgi:hypothetical protein